ncbi:unnamed protein product [Cuscuta campestris]|uniref:Integrase catalytic domain-containing protein n=1 Tax=Cuscuta campestris TaxID=132261 RepID=A0A484N1J0_9ASTE|nr:unnamed protein product [Cuscuta campestris]
MDQLIARGPPPRPERPALGNTTWRRPAASAAAITAGEGQEDERRHLGRDCENLDEEERGGKRKSESILVVLCQGDQELGTGQRERQHDLCRNTKGGRVTQSGAGRGSRGSCPGSGRAVARGEGDMTGVDPRIIYHRLAIDPAHKLVKQKKRFLSSERRDFVTKQDLERVFRIMKRYQLRLNLKKYTFGVQGGKFLGHMVSRREIEPNPEKVKVILEMEPPRNVKEVQQLAGRIAALSRFLSKIADRLAPFFQTIKKSRGFIWTKECQRSFEGLKNTALEMLKAFGAYQIEQVPREENAEADILSKLSPDSLDNIKAMTQEEELFEPSISPGQVLVFTLNEPDWIDELTMYIIAGRYQQIRLHPKLSSDTHLAIRWSVGGCISERTMIITDNGTQFEARGFNAFLQSWGIKHSYAAVRYPQTNGQDHPKEGHGETPFALMYGFEARAPAETSLLSYRVEMFDAQENEESLRAELHLIDERRERAYIWAENYRRQVKSYHD